MAKASKKRAAADAPADETDLKSQGPISLAALMSKTAIYKVAHFWVVGDTPLITHAWSEKAKTEMLQKQIGAVRAAREKRDPQADFISSLYEMTPANEKTKEPAVYGFPVTGIKNCIAASAHKDKGIAQTTVKAALFLYAEMTRVRPALAGAICDMPLVRIWGGQPEMREDMVKIGSGLNKVASLAYRGQFTHWAFKLKARFNPKVLSPEALAFLIQESGLACGLGEWRNERKGVFGAFHLGSPEEEREWEAYANGRGRLPTGEQFKMAAE